ncbi:serine hydrolase [Cyanobium sp. NIES-981]|uniref:serine hydrolase n=1 Tax=Cyanobium sp. NIES-981 TaxID=1851505 RepID=UPI0007DE2A01|nr:serine hydrolase [Cyanobium sp. NIES-981]SBO43583.1 Beta-lactamase superfamily protein [Cyanobium sp. NIES-981]
MAFYSPDPAMAQVLADLVGLLELQGRLGLAQQLSITWVRFDRSQIGAALDGGSEAFWQRRPPGAGWGGDRQRYPASVVKLVYLIAAEAWLQEGLLEPDQELQRALEDMIRDSSNDATGLVVDLLSGTTSGPALPPERMRAWTAQRQLVNQWLTAMAWSELQGCNACQKTWGEGPYGRERVFYGSELENRNSLSSDAASRLLLAVIASALVSPPACGRMRQILWRPLDPASRTADPENQVDGFLGAGLPEGASLWSKAGWMSQARHDVAYVEAEGHSPFLLAVFSEGAAQAADATLLPDIAAHLAHACRLSGTGTG